MLDERELWKKICAGDGQAFDAWYCETAPRLRTFLHHLLASPHAAEDVMQDTYSQRSPMINGSHSWRSDDQDVASEGMPPCA